MILLTVVFWFVLGIPSALVFLQLGRRDLAWAVTPFAGALAFLVPVIATGWTGGSYAGWWWKSFLSALVIGGLCRVLLGRYAAGDWQAPKISAYDKLISVTTAVALLSFVTIGFVLAGGWPGFGWDGLSIWLLHARMLTEYSAFPTEVFASSQLWRSHMDYPFLMPTLYARLLPAGVPMHKASMVFGVVLAVVPGAVFLGLRRYLPISLAAAAAFAPLIGVPGMNHYHGYADVLLVMFGTGGFLFLLLGVMHDDRAASVLGVLMLACATSTKNEGIVWLFCAAAGAALLRLLLGRNLKSTLVHAAGIVVPALLPALLWNRVCARAGVANDLSSALRFDLLAERLYPVFSATFWRLLMNNKWVVLCVLAGIAWLTFRPKHPVRLRFTVATLCAPGLYLAGLLIIYLATPYDLAYHIKTSMNRTLGMIVPAVMVAAFAMYSAGKSLSRTDPG